MQAGNLNILPGQNCLSAPVYRIAFQIAADFHLVVPGELLHTSLCFSCKGIGQFIVQIDHQFVFRSLVQIDILLGRHIFCHVLVHIQMVGGQIRHHSHVGRSLHGHELEGTKFHHGKILFRHLPCQRQQRLADIAAQPHRIPGVLQHFGNQSGCRGFTIGAGDGNDFAGTNRKESLHFRGDRRTFSLQLHKSRDIRPHTGRTEHNVTGKPFQIVPTHLQRGTGLLQFQHFLIQFFPRRHITGRHTQTAFQQHPNQRTVADTDPQHQNFLSPQTFKIGIEFIFHGTGPISSCYSFIILLCAGFCNGV